MLKLTNLQFALLLLVWLELTTFIVMDGVDFGTGIATIFNHEKDYKDQLIRSIGVVWSGREAWMIVGFALIFAAFPGWYSAIFSGFYPVFIILIVALTMRGLSFEYIDKWQHDKFNIMWRWIFFLGNIVPPFIFGVVFSLFNSGLPIGQNGLLAFKLSTIFNPFALMTGIMFILFALQTSMIRESAFMTEKYQGKITDYQKKLNTIVPIAFVIEIIIYLVVGQGLKLHPIITVALLLLSLLLLIAIRFDEKFKKLHYPMIIISMAAFVISFFWSIFPNVIMSTEGFNLNAQNTASARESQLWAAWLVALMLFLIIFVQGITHYIFRKKYQVKDSDINY